MKIVLPDKIDLVAKHLAEIRSLGDVTVYNDVPRSEEEIIERIKDAEIITANWIEVTENIIKSTSSLEYIIVPAVGYEWVDVIVASEVGIKVLNCPIHNTYAVVEHTIALMFAIARRMVESNANLKQGEWKPLKYVGVELKGKRLGLIGYGNIGRKIAKLAQNLGMKVSYANTEASAEELDKIIATSDFVSLHVPHTKETEHLIDERRLKLMKKDACLINTARGAVVDQKALLKALKARYLAGAALDVFEDEPLTGIPTEEILELVKLPNVVATPHIAFNTREASYRLGEELIANIKACIEGKPIPTNVVN